MVTPEFKAQMFAWLNHYGPLACVGFVLVCAIASARPKRDR